MTTRSYVGIDASKDRLNVAVPGERQEKQVNHTQAGMGELSKTVAARGVG